MALSRFEHARAKVGAKLLDLLKPGWHKLIKIDKLQLSSCSTCVLGQLFGDYSAGAERLFAMRSEDSGEDSGEGHGPGSVTEAAVESGFVIENLGDPQYGGQGYYDNLTEAWKHEIRKRQNKGASKRA